MTASATRCAVEDPLAACRTRASPPACSTTPTAQPKARRPSSATACSTTATWYGWGWPAYGAYAGWGYAGYYGNYYGGYYGGYAGGYGGYGRGYGWSGGVRLKVDRRDAEVFVDGYYAGTVDDFDGVFQELRLEDGGYRIEIRAPGFETLVFDVRVQPGRTITYRGHMTPAP